MPIEQLRTFLFVGLCVVVFLMWQAWQIDYGARRDLRPDATSTAQDSTPTTPVPSSSPADVPQAPALSATAATIDGRAVAPVVPDAMVEARTGRTVEIQTDTVRASISLDGGTLTRLELVRYPVSTEQPDVPFRLLDDSDRRGAFFVGQTGLLGDPGAPSHHAPFSSDEAGYRLAKGSDELRVVLTAEDTAPLMFRKIYTFRRDSYVIDVSYEVENRSDQAWSGRMYAQFQRSPPESQGGLFHTYTYTGGVLSSSDKPYEKFDFSDMSKTDVARTVQGGWVAMIQHYFVGAWLPPAEADNHYYTKALSTDRYVIGVVGPVTRVQPGASETVSMRAFIGPKTQSRMAEAAPHLERTVDYGWLFFIAEPLFWLLQKIHSFVGNWGWSIILLTVLVKLAFFQLSATSYKSMARMRKLQPRLTALRERYGDDRQRMNQAMMEMYKTEKINPLGGCLPILVQIPVFISLYWVLLESVELRQASFMFWLHDLSLHDPYFVLPVLMGATMYIQQKLNPAPPDPIQAKIMMALPFVFTFFFLFFPAGLVLYWFVNNLLSIAQQWVITKKIVGET